MYVGLAASFQLERHCVDVVSLPQGIMLWLECSVQGMSNEDLKSLQSLVEEQIQENLGMAMIYTIVTAAQEWMLDKVTHIHQSSDYCIRSAPAMSVYDKLVLLLSSSRDKRKGAKLLLRFISLAALNSILQIITVCI